MLAGILEVSPGEVFHLGWWCPKDVLVVFGEEPGDRCLEMGHIAIVYWIPSMPDNLVHLKRGGGIRPLWSTWATGWVLKGLQWCDRSLLESAVDRLGFSG